jgi:uncharacterized protein (DUF1684 family)
MVPALAAVLLVSCGAERASAPATQPVDPQAHARDVEQWRADRLARLTAGDGWLTLVGLFWIEDGVSKIGSNPGHEVVLPAKLPRDVGTVTLERGEARFRPAAGIDLPETALQPDSASDYPQLQIGTVRFYLIERGGRFGIRVKDADSPARREFAGLDYFPIDPGWRVEAKFVPAPHTVTFDTEVGTQETGQSPGYAEFEREGTRYRLDGVREDDELFFVIKDATSGKTTYAASRFLYTGLPRDGRLTLDFNKAYNPPCVFTDFATCPLPPEGNRMAAAVEAGERKYARGH